MGTNLQEGQSQGEAGPGQCDAGNFRRQGAVLPSPALGAHAQTGPLSWQGTALPASPRCPLALKDLCPPLARLPHRARAALRVPSHPVVAAGKVFVPRRFLPRKNTLTDPFPSPLPPDPESTAHGLRGSLWFLKRALAGALPFLACPPGMTWPFCYCVCHPSARR